jgi:hypothetical protein
MAKPNSENRFIVDETIYYNICLLIIFFKSMYSRPLTIVIDSDPSIINQSISFPK